VHCETPASAPSANELVLPTTCQVVSAVVLPKRTNKTWLSFFFFLSAVELFLKRLNVAAGVS
jgi:hypothetical protein